VKKKAYKILVAVVLVCMSSAFSHPFLSNVEPVCLVTDGVAILHIQADVTKNADTTIVISAPEAAGSLGSPNHSGDVLAWQKRLLGKHLEKIIKSNKSMSVRLQMPGNDNFVVQVSKDKKGILVPVVYANAPTCPAWITQTVSKAFHDAKTQKAGFSRAARAGIAVIGVVGMVAGAFSKVGGVHPGGNAKSSNGAVAGRSPLGNTVQDVATVAVQGLRQGEPDLGALGQAPRETGLACDGCTALKSDVSDMQRDVCAAELATDGAASGCSADFLARGDGAVDLQSVPDEGQWVCDLCATLNAASTANCVLCAFQKPLAAIAIDVGPSKIQGAPFADESCAVAERNVSNSCAPVSSDVDVVSADLVSEHAHSIIPVDHAVAGERDPKDSLLSLPERCFRRVHLVLSSSVQHSESSEQVFKVTDERVREAQEIIAQRACGADNSVVKQFCQHMSGNYIVVLARSEDGKPLFTVAVRDEINQKLADIDVSEPASQLSTKWPHSYQDLAVERVVQEAYATIMAYLVERQLRLIEFEPPEV